MFAYIPLGLYVLSTAAGLILIKIGSSAGAIVELINGRLAFHLSIVNILGILLYGISFLLYTFLIAKNDLGYIIPLTTGLVYVLIFAASFIVFKEPFSALKLAAIVMILVGVSLLNLPVPSK